MFINPLAALQMRYRISGWLATDSTLFKAPSHFVVWEGQVQTNRKHKVSQGLARQNKRLNIVLDLASPSFINIKSQILRHKF